MSPKPDPDLFRRLVAEPESECVEFKQSWFDPAAIGRYASALANSARLDGRSAGYVVWGVSRTGEVVGTKTDPRAQVVQKEPFPFWLKKRLSPADHGVLFYSGDLDGKPMMAMITPAADRIPVKFEHIAYVRVGSATPSLEDHPDLERKLQSILSTTRYEDDPAREHVTAAEVFELLEVRKALELLQVTPATADDEMLNQLERFNVLATEGAGRWTITNLGAILFATSLEAFGRGYSRKAPRVIEYTGVSRVETESERVGTRGYAIAFDGLVRFVNRHLPQREELGAVRREEVPVFPVIAVRELIANALVHQDFSVRGAGPVVGIFPGRIEISNPGVPLGDVDRLIDEPPRSRNEEIARLMRQIGYCEERGSGIDKIISEAEAAQLPPPQFGVSGQSFVATLYGPRSYGDMTSDERLRACYQHACLLWVSGGQAVTNGSMRARFGLASARSAAISRLFSEAVDSNLIKPADPSNQSRSQASYVPYWV